MKRSFGIYALLGVLTTVGAASVAVAAAVILHVILDGEVARLTSVVTVVSLLAGGVIVITGLVLMAVCINFERRLILDLHQLPRDFQRLLRFGKDEPLAGEGRRDMVGRTAKRLRVLGRQIRDELSAQAEIERLAITDALTDLPNRRGLMTSLDAVLAGLKPDRTVALLHVDLDHFKLVNDTLGHLAGDQVLQEATQRMSGVLRGSDMLARLGGDEFIIVAHGVENAEVLATLCDRVVRQFAQPIRFGEEHCNVGASVGGRLVFGTESSLEARRLLSDADVALCEAKAAGRNRWVIFTEEMAETIQRRTRQSREIREALLDGEFRAWYQPVVDVETGAICGIELLTRWEHPERGLLLPEAFLLPAETNNMFEEIGLQVLEAACFELKAWQSQGLQVPVLHVNMTRVQLVAPGVVDKVSWILDDCNIQPDRVVLEISEQNCEGRSVEVVFATLKRFADLGIETTLDDFGSLSSSLANVTKTGARRIKCSRALVAGLSDPDTEDDTRMMLTGVVSFGRGIGVDIIAKGVEDDAQQQRLTGLGISLMQGDGLAAPMSGPDLSNLLPVAAPITGDHQKSA
ncbi:MAG: putative bifunctional diguanylate cyclase/phosphodiesterase [Paracoccaceae bacterium]